MGHDETPRWDGDQALDLGFYGVLQGSTRFYKVRQGSARFLRVPSSRDGFLQKLAVGARVGDRLLHGLADGRTLDEGRPIKADGLEFFVKGYLMGLKDRIDLLENKPATIDDTKTRTVIYRDQSRQIVQISFIHIKDRVYRLRLTQTSAAFDEERLKIFDSVKVLN